MHYNTSYLTKQNQNTECIIPDHTQSHVTAQHTMHNHNTTHLTTTKKKKEKKKKNPINSRLTRPDHSILHSASRLFSFKNAVQQQGKHHNTKSQHSTLCHTKSQLTVEQHNTPRHTILQYTTTYHNITQHASKHTTLQTHHFSTPHQPLQAGHVCEGCI